MKILYFLVLIINIRNCIQYTKLEFSEEQPIKNYISFIVSSSAPYIPKINTKSNPKISIVIPVYNDEKNIKNILKNIQYQSTKEIEIIFIDDNSEDRTKSIILEYKKEDHRIKLIKNDKNRGLLYNIINGGLYAKGEYVTFMNSKDFYINHQILDILYDTCVDNNLDILEFDYYGSKFNSINLEFNEIYLHSKDNKKTYNKIFSQIDIKKGFYYNKENKDTKDNILSGIIYNKIFSHKEIEKISELLGEDFWRQNYIYKIDFIIELAISRTAENIMFLNKCGILHWMEKPDEKIKYHEDSNKKLGDLFSILEKAFELTEKESDTEYLKIKLLNILKEIDNRQLFARSYHYERILNLCKKIFTWKYISKKGKSIAKKFAKSTIEYEIPQKVKYSEFFDDKHMIDENYDINNKKKKEKNIEIKKDDKTIEKKEKDKKEENIKKKKKKKKEENKIEDIDQIDGYIEDF